MAPLTPHDALCDGERKEYARGTFEGESSFVVVAIGEIVVINAVRRLAWGRVPESTLVDSIASVPIDMAGSWGLRQGIPPSTHAFERCARHPFRSFTSRRPRTGHDGMTTCSASRLTPHVVVRTEVKR